MTCEECTITDPLPWCDCIPGETCRGPCRQRAHHPTRCPKWLARFVLGPVDGLEWSVPEDSAELLVPVFAEPIGVACESEIGVPPELPVRAAVYELWARNEELRALVYRYRETR